MAIWFDGVAASAHLITSRSKHLTPSPSPEHLTPSPSPARRGGRGSYNAFQYLVYLFSNFYTYHILLSRAPLAFRRGAGGEVFRGAGGECSGGELKGGCKKIQESKARIFRNILLILPIAAAYMESIRHSIFLRGIFLLLIFPICIRPVYSQNIESRIENTRDFFFKDYQFNADFNYATSAERTLPNSVLLLHKDLGYQHQSPFYSHLPQTFFLYFLKNIKEIPPNYSLLYMICILLI